MDGDVFWLKLLPKEIDWILGGRAQNLDLPEEYETHGTVSIELMRKMLLAVIEEYKQDLQGIEIYDVREIDGQLKGVGRKFDLEKFREQIQIIETPRDIAKILVKIASYYAPDYGKVDHPCHQWCSKWGMCPNIQKPAITSLLQYMCTKYREMLHA